MAGVGRLEFQNTKHYNYAKALSIAILKMGSISYHDDSAIWYFTTRKEVYENDNFKIIYQPHKDTEMYDSDLVSFIIVGNGFKITKKFFNETKYVFNDIKLLVEDSYNLILDETGNKWFNKLKNPNFTNIMLLNRDLYFDNGRIKLEFKIRGMDNEGCNHHFTPFFIEMLLNDKLEGNLDDEFDKYKKELEYNKDYFTEPSNKC